MKGKDNVKRILGLLVAAIMMLTSVGMVFAEGADLENGDAADTSVVDQTEASDEENDEAADEENDEAADEENDEAADEENDEAADEENDEASNEENDEASDEEDDEASDEENDEASDEENDEASDEENDEASDEENDEASDEENDEASDEENTVTFSDIEGHWAADRIILWAEKEVVSGYPDGSFKPENNITRAEFMSLINKSMGYITEVAIDYSDVPENEWYASVVRRAEAAGYISGYGDGTMKPENFITREEVAAIISKINQLEQDAEASEVFTDAISAWAKGHVGAVAAARYMNGYVDNQEVRTFGALNNIKRAEAVVVIHNMFRELEEQDEEVDEDENNNEEQDEEVDEDENNNEEQDEEVDEDENNDEEQDEEVDEDENNDEEQDEEVDEDENNDEKQDEEEGNDTEQN
ncbi:S-layer homology domain-containing protein [Clostridium formicaceticum]|uniref:Cellulosome-anchoring protein n=1 Tax=Clostridium formicaceticum TaxID=1497 RepID=A0AAC9RFL7_9CLOT|nr:S-layer homology domain-containing protein [Clostridium formicaceticum]AOY75541.1 hypothetical protein BJL90_06305 [Clostridium formicaceticum]ARE85836.1 Cellulosome-anchoring protein precursor [Clostridium formicaceticum]